MCTSVCPVSRAHAASGVLRITGHSQLNLSFPQGFAGQLDLCSAGGSPHFFPVHESLSQPSGSSSSSFVPQLLGNQDHIKVELEKLKKTYDSQHQKLEERV